MNKAVWLWYYESCEAFDRTVCAHPNRPGPRATLVPMWLFHAWPSAFPHAFASERRLVSSNANLRQRMMKSEVLADRESMRYALDLHDRLPEPPLVGSAERDDLLEQRVPGYKEIAVGFEELLRGRRPS